jgi:CheY-like chemotaxis protein
MRLHGGKASAASDGPGRGSTFTLTIPLSVMAGDAGYDRVQAEREKANDSLKILIIEDNRDAARSLQLLLSILGHDVRVAYDGRAGLKAIEDSPPDVVFSDLGLPGGLDGFAVAETIRRDVSLSDVYLIALSGYGHDDDRQRAQLAGFDLHLVKPVELRSLQTALRAVPAVDQQI